MLLQKKQKAHDIVDILWVTFALQDPQTDL